MVGGAAFLSPQGAEHAAKDEMVLHRLEEKSIFLKTQVLVQRENPSKLVSEFVRVFMKRLTQVGLYQPDLPPFAGEARHVDSPQPSFVATSVAAA